LAVAASFTVGCAADLDQSETSQPLVGGADLIESALSEPPASSGIGSSFSVTDTVTNQGTADATASTTRYYLSTDAMKSVGDKQLTGTRAVGAIVAGGTDSGTASVTVPAIASGSYYLIACADGAGAVAEADETNNCTASTGTVAIGGADLVESAVSNPPANVISGVPFSITDTVTNNGSVGAGASVTVYYVSLDGVHVAAGTLSIGRRNVGAIAAGGTDTATATVATQGGTPQGTYYVLACADRTNLVGETDDNNNCIASATTMTMTAPDLLEGSVSVAPTPVDNVNGTLAITDTVTNMSSTDAGASATQYFLSTDGTTYIGWLRACTVAGPIPEHDAPMLTGGSSDTATTNAEVCYHDRTTNQYVPIPPGNYYLLACADELHQVAEITETNNCATSNQFTVTQCGNGVLESGEACDDGNVTSGDGCSSTCTIDGATDLVVSAMTNPPANTLNGSSFNITDTVTNSGILPATNSSRVRYYLSVDTLKSPSDPVLTGSRSVPALAAGASSSGTVSLGVSNVLGGTYYVIACADADNTVVEGNEANNCRVSTTRVTVGGGDLVETAVSNPPAAAVNGDSFSVTDTARNVGTGPAGASTTWIYLSLDRAHPAPGTVVLVKRSVPTLNVNVSSTGTSTAVIANGTPPGTYYLLACADRNYVVLESNENNNCIASTGTVSVTAPDLTETAVSLSSASVGFGAPVDVTETVTNGTMSAAGASTTRFWVSTDATKNATDLFMRNCTTGAAITRSVPSLAASGSSTGTTTVPLCYRDSTGIHSVAAGSYFLFACADDTATVSESNESNNCTSTALTITP
jgi:cysteine-rich repeat protein